MTDREIKYLVDKQHIPAYKLESVLADEKRGVSIRRRVIEDLAQKPRVLETVPFTHYDYKLVLGAGCENVIGYVPIPLGIAGPLLMNNKRYYVPLATTEGCLVASTNRGLSCLTLIGWGQ